jgi:hypothetical protein
MSDEAVAEPSDRAGGGASRASTQEASSWIGDRLDEMAGVGVGRVEGLLVDALNGETEWLLVRRGRMGTCCAVPAREAVGAAGHVWAPWKRGTIRSSSEVEPGASLAVAEELALCAHYGIGEGVGRAAELAGRPRSELSARPAG